MKNNQKGFSVVEALLILVAIGLIGFVGWYVWNASKSNSTSDSQTNNTQQTTKSKYTVKNVDVKIFTKNDLAKIPASAPAGFVEAFSKVAESQISKPNQDGCYAMYYIEKISDINVLAGKGLYEKKNGAVVDNSSICGGGARSIWAISNGKWVEVAGGNDDIPCSEITSPKVYSEFAKECYDAAKQHVIPNPNGSITSVN